ncbi:hypothetical protein ACP4OV_027353 [Aristida adscensionis]
MARSGGPPPATRRRLSCAPTIHCLDGDLLRRVLLRLPSLAALVRAASAWVEFRRAVASDPVFRLRFRAAHSPLVGFFFDPPEDTAPAVPSFLPARRDDPDLARLIRSWDFFLTPLHVSPEEVNPRWGVVDVRGGKLLLQMTIDPTLRLLAVLNPMARPGRVQAYFNLSAASIRALEEGDPHIHMYFKMPRLLCADEDPSRFRIFCLINDESRVRVLVFAHDDKDGLLLPWVPAPGRQDPEHGSLLWLEEGILVGHFIYWFYRNHRYVVIMDTRELSLGYHVQAVHPSLNLSDYEHYLLLGGHTVNANDLEPSLHIVYADGSRICCKLSALHGNPAEPWIAGGVTDLGTQFDQMAVFVPGLLLEALKDGFLYFAIPQTEQYAAPCWFLSFNMETRELEKLFLRLEDANFQPYHMPWPRFLLGDYGSFAGKDALTSA